MANANKPRPNWETLATTGTVTPNSGAKNKELTMTGDVTLNAPIDLFQGDVFEIHITLGGNTLTLDAAYVSRKTTPPTLLEKSAIACRLFPDGVLYYWDMYSGA